jgi:protein SCO1
VKMIRPVYILWAALLLVSGSAEILSRSTQKDCHKDSSSEANPYAPPPITVPEVKVVDQHGRKLNFYKDLVEGKTVVVNFIYTDCTFVCPPVGMNMARFNRLLKKEKRDVRFIWVSRDPARDTPERMRKWGEKFGKGLDWVLLTGEVEEINKISEALTGGLSEAGAHGALTLIGNETRKIWIRSDGTSPAQKLGSMLNEVSN